MVSDANSKGPSSLARTGVFAVVIAIVVFVILRQVRSRTIETTHETFALNKTAVRFAAIAIDDDLRAVALDNDSVMSSSSQDFSYWSGIDLKATSKEYETAYDANEIAADNLYKGKKILITGTLTGIEKDFTGSGYLDLAGSDPFLPGVHAQLTFGSMNEAAGMKKGLHLSLSCTGAGRVVAIAVLNECQPAEDYLNAREPLIESRVRSVLTGNAAVSESSARLVSIAYVAGLLLPSNSPCLNGDVQSCSKEFKALLQDSGKRQEAQDKAKQVVAKIKITH